ncbi:MAG: GAF domain-containing protein, partial [Candidatus Omnitrophica bacterium]|nr:GAF domain-containing protein [Candidatus Omnitrophota bacterium]
MIAPIAFLLWVIVFLASFPILRLDLYLTHQWVAAQFYVSLLILTLSWAFSGPPAAAVLSGLSALLALYVGLSAKEPAIFLQLVLYSVLFVTVVLFLQKTQKTTSDKQILREKLLEDVHAAAEAIGKKKVLKKSLEQKMGRFMDLHRFSEELKGMQTLEGAAQKITQEAADALDQADQTVLYLVDPAQQELSLVASVRPGGVVVKEKNGTLFDRWVMKKSQGLMVEDVKTDFRFPHEEETGEGRIRSLCVSPLMTEKKVLGVVRVSASRPQAFNADDLRLLDIFSSLGAVTL